MRYAAIGYDLHRTTLLRRRWLALCFMRCRVNEEANRNVNDRSWH